MAEKSKELNEQHQHHGNVDEPQQKRREPNECEDDANAVETKTITNIYYDCLERIFDFLDIESLLMVANTCKRLQIAAAAKFSDEYGDRLIVLDIHSDIKPSVHLYGSSRIRVTSLKLCLPFLRCFGGKITDLYAFYNRHRSKDGYLDQYINRYCADTLIDISVYFKSKFLYEAFGKPFKNVESVALMGCHLSGESIPDFTNLFPKMRHLEVIGCFIAGTASMNIHFPHLEDLELNMTLNRTDNDRNESAMKIVESNPQLQTLEISSDFEMTLNTLLTKIHGNSTITKLNVNFDSGPIDVNANELDRFVAEHPLVVELKFEVYRLTADDAINVIRQMRSLKQIGFLVSSRTECDRIIKEFEGEWKSEVTATYDGKFYIQLNR